MDLCEQLFESRTSVFFTLGVDGKCDNIVIIQVEAKASNKSDKEINLEKKSSGVSSPISMTRSSPFKATLSVLLFSWKMVSMVSHAALAEAGLVLIILFRSVGERVGKIHNFTMESAVIHSSVGGSDVDVDPSMWFSTLKLLQCPLKK
ncbi:hypothetical protein Tco_1343548 [Tanacetum coccineum]